MVEVSLMTNWKQTIFVLVPMCLISCLRQPLFFALVPMCLISCLRQHQADSVLCADISVGPLKRMYVMAHGDG